MSIRQGVFRIGETIELSGQFVPADVTGAKFTIAKPDGTLAVVNVTPVAGLVSTTVAGDLVGTWRIRLECAEPQVAVSESKFEVVESTVLQPQAISVTISPTLFTAGVTAV